MALAQLLESGRYMFKRVCDAGHQVVAISFMFIGTCFEGGEMGRPGRQRRTFERPWGHSRAITNAQACRLSCFLFKVLFGEGCKFGAVFFLDSTPLAIEGLDVVEPGDPTGNPYVRRFEAILQQGTVRSSVAQAGKGGIDEP